MSDIEEQLLHALDHIGAAISFAEPQSVAATLLVTIYDEIESALGTLNPDYKEDTDE